MPGVRSAVTGSDAVLDGLEVLGATHPDSVKVDTNITSVNEHKFKLELDGDS